MNIEGRHKKKRISNVEGMYSARRELLCRTVYFIKKIEQSDTTNLQSSIFNSGLSGLGLFRGRFGGQWIRFFKPGIAFINNIPHQINNQ